MVIHSMKMTQKRIKGNEEHLRNMYTLIVNSQKDLLIQGLPKHKPEGEMI